MSNFLFRAWPKQILAVVLVIGSCFLLLPGAFSQGTQVSIGLHATVVSVDDANGLLGGQINVGNVLTGTFTFHLVANRTQRQGKDGTYFFTSGAGITIQTGTTQNGQVFTFKTDPGNIDFQIECVKSTLDTSGSARDQFVVRSYNNLPVNNLVTVDHISWQLDDRTALSGITTSMPSAPLNLSKWQSIFGLTIRGRSTTDEAATYVIRAQVSELFNQSSK